MSYEVFARKYRPQTFDDLVGQTHVSRTLKNAVAQNRLAHAYLFVGPRGIGKTSTARILAKSLNCVKGPTVTPCGVCDNCREIAAGNSLDVIEIDGASNNSVDDVRQLRDNVRYAPAKGRYKIYLIDEVHMLSAQAFNALLKTLEEPPAHVKFIFATTEPQKVLPTILSRCQRFDLHRIPANLIAQHLQFIAGKEKINLPPAAAHAIARGAEGGLRDAESMLDLIDQFADAEGRMKWAPNKKLHFEVAIIKAIQSLGQATLDEVIENLSALRDGGRVRRPALVAGIGDAGEEPARKTGITDPGYSKNKTSRVAESPPKYKAAESSADVDPARVWEQLSAKIPVQKAFLRNSAAAAHVLGIEGRNFQLGFSPNEKAMMDILGTQTNRKFLETLLHEITGKDWTVKLTVSDKLPPKHAVASESGKGFHSEDFKDDPLIQEAIEMFKAQIKS